MAVDLTTDPGGLFRRLGRIGHAINSINRFISNVDLTAAGLRSVGAFIDLVQDQYELTRQDLTQGLYAQRDSYRSAQTSLKQFLRELARDTVIEMVDDDSPLASKSLTPALEELIFQMVSASASVPRPTVSATPTAGVSNVGDGVMAASVIGPDGRQLDYVLAESIVVRCTGDSQSQSATAGSEPFSYAGAARQGDPLFWDWPRGSGSQGTLVAVDASGDNSGGNVLQNSSFSVFTTANHPDNWTKVAGVIGTTILQATGSNAYSGNSGLALVGDGATLHSLTQSFSVTPVTTTDAGGTSYRLSPRQVFAVCLRHKVSAAATGSFRVSLVDGSGNVINDDQGTPNTITIDVSTLSTSWSSSRGYFRTPSVLPAVVRLRLSFVSTPLSSGQTLYVDHLAMAEATQLYDGGPYAAVFSGAVPYVINDRFTLAVANDWLTSSKWAGLLERLFDLRTLGLAIPSSASPTISDSLIA